MIQLSRINRIASLAIVPLMALAIVVGVQFAGDSSKAAAMPTAGTLVVAQLRGDALVFFDLSGSAGTQTLALPGPPHEFAASDGKLYLTLGRANALVELQTAVPAIRRIYSLAGEPNGIAVDGGDLLVTLDKGNALVRVDRATLSERSRVLTGETPHNVALAGGIAYVTDARDNALRAVELAAGTAVTSPTGVLPESVAVVGGFVVTADADGNTITIIRRDGFTTVGSMRMDGRPVRVIALDDTHVAVALNVAGEVAIVDVAQHATEKRISTLGHPDGMCLSPDGQYLAVASNETGAVQLFRRSDWALAGALQVGGGPGACTWLP